MIVSQVGCRNWAQIAELMPGRISKQCRERWINHLDPNLCKQQWTPEEDRRILELHAQLGNKWSKISKFIDGRTDNAIKNRFNSNLKRQLALGKPIPTYTRTSTVLKQSEEAPRKRDSKKEEKKQDDGA